MSDLEKFAPEPFISKMLGMGDIQGLVEQMQDIAAANPDKQKEVLKNLEQGKFSIKDWREQMQTVMNMYLYSSSCHAEADHCIGVP